jgi:hypothetical protein
MAIFSKPVSELIRQRFSCRTYQKKPLVAEDLRSLEEFTYSCQEGPRGSLIRYQIAAATENDSQKLKGLGTYGFIHDPVAFIIGAIQDGPDSLEDFGYQTEVAILKATELGIGSCWLGGTFTKSRFSRIMGLHDGENIPSVISLGYPSDQQAWLDRISRIYAGSDRRFDRDILFFNGSFQSPLVEDDAGLFAEPLEMVRLAPSASNKQPWRIVRQEENWHFYIHRTKKYPSPIFDFLLNLADLQRIDLGIAMAHFELSARENNLDGAWVKKDPGLPLPNSWTEYNISWIAD